MNDKLKMQHSIIQGTELFRLIAEIEPLLASVMLPNTISGKFVDIKPGQLLDLRSDSRKATALVEGKRYRIQEVQRDGTFKLQKDFEDKISVA